MDAAPISSRRALLGTAAALAAAVVLAYLNSLGGAFIFDDVGSIERNPSIRHLWPLVPGPLAPPGWGMTVEGRPLLNISFALNYALGGKAVLGYHLGNVAIHLGSALLLLGLVRRTLLRPRAGGYAPGRALLVGGGAAFLWALHPVGTEAVAYMVQRAESLMALLVLLTLYAFVRAVEEEPARGKWLALSVAAALLGMAAKEVAALGPVLVLLYDRTFVAGSFRAALRARPRYYAALAATWLLLGALLLSSHERGGTAGFGIGVPWSIYGLHQFGSLVHYLRVAFWPWPLVFNGASAGSPAAFPVDVPETAACVVVVAALAGATAWALVRRPALGFLGAWFFLLLLPSSSIVPLFDFEWEHRVYLSLAALMVGLALAAERWLGRRAGFLLGALAVVWGATTVARNADYRDPLALWTQTVRVKPGSALARDYLGYSLMEKGDLQGAEEQIAAALRIDSARQTSHNEMGTLLFHEGHLRAAEAEFREGIRLVPGDSIAWGNLGRALAAEEKPVEALAALDVSRRLHADVPEVEVNRGIALLQLRRAAEAEEAFRGALRGDADLSAAWNGLGATLAEQEKWDEAAAAFSRAALLAPGNANPRVNLGNALLHAGRRGEAAAAFDEGLRLEPGNAEALKGLRTASDPKAAPASQR
jgi:tetratricopeptide (TPR) repeat protein